MGDPGFAAFRKLSGRGNLVPVWMEVPADCLTPVMAYRATTRRSLRSFLLESVEGGDRIARYSFLGRDPYLALSARGRTIEEQRRGRRARTEGDFLDRLREIFSRLHPVTVPGLPRFTGGAVGFIGYEAVRLFEPSGRAPAPAGLPADDGIPPLPDAWFGLYDTILAFDHPRQVLLLIASVMTESGGSLRSQHAAALSRLQRLAADLARGSAGRAGGGAGPGGGRGRSRRRAPARSNVTRRAYASMVSAAQDYIRQGEIYQVVLSQRFKSRLSCEPFAVYRALRRINPSPYMYFLRDGTTSLAGASPEMLVRVEGRQAELHPIAGTRARGRDPEADAALEAELRSDPKERAEHVMLVDLGRNDLGRVCEAGSVRVPDLMRVERFSHVMHLVSRVTGTLARGMDAFDALRACFPAGTVAGAPKVRAMEIIDELERARRGPYAGAVCYMDYSGNLDSCIIIRTMVAVGRLAYVQAGGGIVADSDPGREYQESLNKARAVLSAIEGARAWAH